jgi:amino acid transporter
VRIEGRRSGARLALRDRSPVEGLARRRLGALEVFAQSVSGTAPSASMAAVPAIVAASAGGGTVWSFVVATVLALLVAASIARFTRRMAAPGGLYSMTAKGLGPGAAYACAVAMVAGYVLLAACTLIGAGLSLDALLGGAGGPLVPGLLALALGVVSGGLVLRGVRLSARVVLLVESVAIGLMLVVFAVLLVAGAAAGGRAPPAPPGSVGGVLVGVLPALAAFIGFEIATSLGAEARRPFRSVPRAVGVTVAVTGVLYVIAAQVQVVGFAAVPGGLASQSEPVAALATAHGPQWLAPVIDAGLAMSFFACALASSTALVRVLFSLARDGVAPRALGRTHPRFRTPHVAVFGVLPLVAAGPAVAAACGIPPGSVFVALATWATCGFLLAYTLVCAAAPVFLHRIGELTRPAVAVGVVIVPILPLVLVAHGVTRPLAAVVLCGVALAGLAGYGWLRLRRPRAFAAIGVYDETVLGDVLLPPGNAA